jgi:purine-binding chemotaxis protein CheW
MADIGSLEELLREMEELQRQLEALCERLRNALPGGSPATGMLSLLLCRVGDQQAAISLEQVSEVALMVELSPLTDAPPWVPGLLNLRGDCFPVLDVLGRFQRASRPPRLSDLIIVCQIGKRHFGLIVQEIFDVGTFPSNAVESIPPEASLAPFLQGVLRQEDDPVLLLSIPRLFALTEPPELEE